MTVKPLEHFLTALGYLSRVPVRMRRAPERTDLVAALAYYPAVGALLGLLSCLLGGLVIWFAPEQGVLAGLIAVAGLAGLSGGFHLDGLADSFDGLLSGKRGAEAGAIMKDSRVGSMGAVAVFLTLAIKAVAAGALLQQQAWGAVVLGPVLGRLWCVLAAARHLPPPWAEEQSLGRMLVGAVPDRSLAIAGASAVVAGLLLFGPLGWLWPAAAALLAGGLFTAAARARLDGVTGDVLGAGVELAETAALVGALLALGAQG